MHGGGEVEGVGVALLLSVEKSVSYWDYYPTEHSPFTLWLFQTRLFDVFVTENETIPSIQRLSLVATGLELRSGQSAMIPPKRQFCYDV